MKRFFKTGAACALALALMSTSAFAAVSETGHSVGFDENGKLDVTIAGDTTGEQVALMVLKGEHKTTDVLASVQNTDIAYIDQKAGAESLAFSDINVGTENVVTVFAGSTNTKKAILLGRATAKQYSLTASTESINVAAGVETTVDLTLTDQDTNKVKDAAVTYKLKNTAGEPADAIAAGFVANVSETSWKFKFPTAGTYEVVFTKNGVSDDVVVCVYERDLPVVNIGKEGEIAKPFVMEQASDSNKVVAAVRVTLAEKQNDKGWIIWSIKTDDGVRHYTNAEICDITGLGAGTPVDFGCKFANDTPNKVTAVNVIYKDATGKVFFTDESDAAFENK